MIENDWLKTYNMVSKSLTITGKRFKKSEKIIEIPEQINGYPIFKISSRAFYNYSNIESIIIPDSVNNIGSQAFAYCKNLREITILSISPPEIGENIFKGCTNVSLSVPSGAKNDYKYILNKKNAGNFTIQEIKFFGNPPQYIGNNELQVKIPEGITEITDMSFPKDRSENIEYIDIPKSVISISLKAFNNCDNLKEIDVNCNNNYYSSEGVLYNSKKDLLIYYPPNKELDSFEIPFGVKTINTNAFRNCNKLNSLTLPSSIISIEKEAFKDCNILKKIVIQCDNPPVLSENAFKNNNEQLTIYVPDTSIEKYKKSAWQFFQIKPNDNNLIICLANSKKQGGKCIIGKNLKKDWIRPISKKHEHGELYGVGHINVLGLLRIPGLIKQKDYIEQLWHLIEHEKEHEKPSNLELEWHKLRQENEKHPYQTEDYFSSDPSEWKQIPPEWVKWENGSLIIKYTDIDTIFNLDDFCDNTDSLWRDNIDGYGKKDMIKEKDAVLLKKSAFLIKIAKSTFRTTYELGKEGKKEANRIEFCYKGKTYSLKITDSNWDNSLFKDTYKRNDFFNKRKMELHDNNSFQYIFDEPQYICVVLGQPRNNYCYLFATSIISHCKFNERDTIF